METAPTERLDAVAQRAHPAHTVRARRALAAIQQRLFGPQGGHARVGRYRVLERIAAGAGGVVYAAQDTRLDRRVALKLVRVEGAVADRDRLVREAKALAMLSHPNVLPIYDVGRYDVGPDSVLELWDVRQSGVYMVTELVEGTTLAQWTQAHARSVPEVLTVYTAAGRGLAAAHAVGLVHRDFKPHNVLLGHDGRVRVLDFGLARTATGSTELDGEPPTEPADRDDQGPSPGVASGSGWDLVSLQGRLTIDGTVLGTPAYMAPEQHVGQTPDARADQYALCVSMYEALTGERPFLGLSVKELAKAKFAGLRSDPTGRMPRWLFRILRRGLAPKPADRFASVDGLLAALQRGRSRTRRIAQTAGVAALGLATIVAVANARDDSEICDANASALAGAWDENRRAVMARAFSAVKADYATNAWERTDAILSRYAAAWLELDREACFAVAQSQRPGAVVDRQRGCLARRKQELGALVDVLTEADAEAVRNAIAAARSLTPVRRCSPDQADASAVPLPTDPDVRRDVVRLQRRVAEADGLHLAGHDATAVAMLETIAGAVEATGFAQLQGEHRLSAARAHGSAGQLTRARTTGQQAYLFALEAGDDRLAAESASVLVDIVGSRLSDIDEGRRWLAHAKLHFNRVGVVRDGWLASREAKLLLREGKLEEARRLVDDAIEEIERTAPDDRVLIHLLDVSAHTHMTTGDIPGSEARYRRAIDLQQRVSGDDHPTLAGLMFALGYALVEADRLDEAKATLAEATGIVSRALGTDHPQYLEARTAAGFMAMSESRHADARAAFEEVVETERRRVGPNHRLLARAYVNLASVANAQGNIEESLRLLEVALEVDERSGDTNPRLRANIRANTAVIYSQLGRRDEAIALTRQTLQELAPYRRGAEYQRTRVLLASLLAYSGRFAEAEALLVPALDDASAPGVPAGIRADIQTLLAHCLWEDPQRRGRARELLDSARATYVALGDARTADLEELERWVAQREKR